MHWGCCGRRCRSHRDQMFTNPDDNHPMHQQRAIMMLQYGTVCEGPRPALNYLHAAVNCPVRAVQVHTAQTPTGTANITRPPAWPCPNKCVACNRCGPPALHRYRYTLAQSTAGCGPAAPCHTRAARQQAYACMPTCHHCHCMGEQQGTAAITGLPTACRSA